MKLQVTKDYEAMSRSAARFITTEIRSRPDLILCASAGGSPTGTYAELAAAYKNNARRFRKLRVLQIDEWGGLEADHPATCRTYLKKHLIDPLKIDSRRFTGFRTNSPDPQRECKRIEKWLRNNGPVDICFLGLGLNGHIAMIEPAEEILTGPHVSKLAESSLHHGMLKDVQPKPGFGLTLGMGDILASRKILLVVSGETKRAMLKRLLAENVSTHLPASFLSLHREVTIICDRAALG